MVLEGAMVPPSKIEQLPIELKLNIASYVSVHEQTSSSFN